MEVIAADLARSLCTTRTDRCLRHKRHNIVSPRKAEFTLDSAPLLLRARCASIVPLGCARRARDRVCDILHQGARGARQPRLLCGVFARIHPRIVCVLRKKHFKFPGHFCSPHSFLQPAVQDMSFRRCFYTLAGRRPRPLHARDARTIALCVLLCLLAQGTGTKTASTHRHTPPLHHSPAQKETT